jgi:DNA helicase-2/ATP-dependent DNA helicase PcrA
MFDLNDRQRQAVDHDGGPLLVLAGAGSGKTGTLAHRVARLLRRGADPERVCLVTC